MRVRRFDDSWSVEFRTARRTYRIGVFHPWRVKDWPLCKFGSLSTIWHPTSTVQARVWIFAIGYQPHP